MGIYSGNVYRALGVRIKGFITQLVLEPTRGESVLDIVLSSQEEFADNVKICEPLGCSDHNHICYQEN